MPSAKILEEKKAQVTALAQKLSAAGSIVLVDYKGINVDADTKLRAELRTEKVDYAVIKNTLLNRACKEAGFEDLIPALAGPTALAVSDDETAPARVIQKYAVKNKNTLNFKLGYVSGKCVTAEELKAIAALPSRETLVAQVAGSFNSIIASFARAVSEVAKQQEPAA